MKNIFNFFSRRKQREALFEEKMKRFEQMFHKFLLVPRIIKLENDILFEHPEKSEKERLLILFDQWFIKNPPQNELCQKELECSSIKSEESRQNILFYITEIYRIQLGVPESSFERGLEGVEIAHVLFEDGYDFVARESDPVMKSILEFAFKR